MFVFVMFVFVIIFWSPCSINNRKEDGGFLLYATCGEIKNTNKQNPDKPTKKPTNKTRTVNVSILFSFKTLFTVSVSGGGGR